MPKPIARFQATVPLTGRTVAQLTYALDGLRETYDMPDDAEITFGALPAHLGNGYTLTAQWTI